MKKQIIALSGGGFSMEPENPILDEYILKQSGKRNHSGRHQCRFNLLV
jgi:peptidase E